MTTVELRPHPARFSDAILEVLQRVLEDEAERHQRHLSVLDPMAGTGRIHELVGDWTTTGIELEPEWAAYHPQTLLGDAMALPFPDHAFDVVATSPCLAQEHRVLTSDLRWVAVGDVEEGEELLAFDEFGTRVRNGGMRARRKWRRATVIRSVPRMVECLRVILVNGDEIITTREHPWLATRYAYQGTGLEWVTSAQLMGRPGRGVGRGHNAGARQPWHVLRQVEPWTIPTSFDAGWLSGMFDGEGSLSLGAHGSPKMQLCQVEGAVVDNAERLMEELQLKPNRIARTDTPAHRQKIVNLYVTGGFPSLMRALGMLRPLRLLEKWSQLPIDTRTIEAQRVQVVAVEPVGRREIQEIETSEGTYIGEGYLMHNCYGNRMADTHNARDVYKMGPRAGQLTDRITYRHKLGRRLSPGNGGGLQWGAKYREAHLRILAEMVRVTAPGGLIVINVSNHIRNHQEVDVAGWWHGAMRLTGLLVPEQDIRVPTPRMRYGQNHGARVEHEWVFVMRRRDDVLDRPQLLAEVG